MGFSQELLFVKRDEKGEAVIERENLGSEFTEGSQELDTISLACPADVKGGCVCHTWEPPNSRPACPMLPGAWKMEDRVTVQEEMSRGGSSNLTASCSSAGLGLAATAIPDREVAEFGSRIWGL